MSSISELYTHSFPLGPEVAEIVGAGPTDRNRLSLLFDKNNKLVNQLNSDLSLIIGRKGSGKTTLLASVQLTEQNALYFYLPSPDLFAKIVREVNALSDGVVFVEQVSRLWEFIIWGVVFKDLATRYGDVQLSEYCSALGVGEATLPYEIISAMLSAVRAFPPTDWPLPEKIAYKQIGPISFLQAKQVAIRILSENKKRVYLLMDSLEDFKLDLPIFGTALAGLLRCLGEFNENKSSSVVLRCCLPAEKYFEFVKLSTNPLKDFRWGMLLHWTAGELIHLAAMRLGCYIKEYHPDLHRARFSKLNIGKREDLEEFWNIVFPTPVKNGLGTLERPIAYILRHTQLLPRHVLVLLNEIISRSIKQNQKKVIDIDPDFVRTGVMEKEERIFSQVIEAYRTPTRDIKTVAETILRDLRTVFDFSDFHKVAARHGRRFDGVADRSELMAILTEIGAIGRVVGESDRYIEGVFEYMLPNKLIFSERDKFCVHPLFTRICNVDHKYDNCKPVYTYWSGIVDSELDKWM